MSLLGIFYAGLSGLDMANVITFLDFPGARSYDQWYSRNMTSATKVFRSIGSETIEKAIEEEVSLSLDNFHNKTLQEWKDEKQTVQVGLVAGFDMGWQKRSSGNTYNSMSDVGFLIGQLSKKIIGVMVYSTRCNLCEIAKKGKVSKNTHMPTQFYWQFKINGEPSSSKTHH